ncbi:MAG: MarR family transcriptional regulator, partial [Alphaproteobacteria bacterium]|nr:MarR family transcriptional regulator [Alphaproteobacteria bacterium]
QALLSIRAGYPGKTRITIGELAKHLLLQHHSTVELVSRMEKAGFIRRATSDSDKRMVLLELTEKSEPLLETLSNDNLDALKEAAPAISDLMRRLSGEKG